MKKTFMLLLMLSLLGNAGFAQPVSKSDSTQIRSTIMSFYNWYLKNQHKLNSFELYKGVKVKDQPPYKINWAEANKYFAFIRSSVPQLGEEFINNQKLFLKECDSAFKADTEGEIPCGFDYDWYTSSQEDAGWLIDELKKSNQWVITTTGEHANVDILGYYMDGDKKVETVLICIAMKKEKARPVEKTSQKKWKIARIGCAYVAPEPVTD